MNKILSDAPSKWFYEEKGQRIGGIDESEMITLIQSKKLSRGSSVWRQGFTDWVKLEDTHLRVHLDQTPPPPLTGEHVNNTLVWVLAFAPIIGIFLEFLIAVVVYKNETRAINAVYDGKLFYITVALNILLSVMDERRLQKAGNNTSAFKGWVWLVPVYLYHRAKHLKQNMAYFAVWIVCFLVVLFDL